MDRSAAQTLSEKIRPLPQPARAATSGEELPVTVIERQAGWRFLGLRELWRYRELLFFLTARDIKVRYKQTVLGAAWAILQPLATMAVLNLFFGRLATVASGSVPYPLYVFAGLLLWTFFANAINSAGQSMVGNHGLVTKVYFPRLLIPLGAVAAGLADFVMAFAMLLVLMLLYGVLPACSILLVPLLLLDLLAAAVGVGALLAALIVSYRDFRHVVPFLVQLWLFATPSVYVQADTLLPPLCRALLPLNPAQGVIAGFRAATLGGPFDLYGLAVSSVVSLALFLVGCLYFRRVERGFADVI